MPRRAGCSGADERGLPRGGWSHVWRRSPSTSARPFTSMTSAGILASADRRRRRFGGLPFHEYYAVKALPNLTITRMLREHGLGMECSSIAELELAGRQLRARGGDLLHLQQHDARGVRGGAVARGDHQHRRRHADRQAAGRPGGLLVPLQPRPGAPWRQADRLARGGQVRAAPRPARGRLRAGARARGRTLRAARDDRLERAHCAAAARDDRDAAWRSRTACTASSGSSSSSSMPAAGSASPIARATRRSTCDAFGQGAGELLRAHASAPGAARSCSSSPAATSPGRTARSSRA